MPKYRVAVMQMTMRYVEIEAEDAETARKLVMDEEWSVNFKEEYEAKEEYWEANPEIEVTRIR